MDLLVLGGTVFLGRQTVVAALERGWNVTMFNRGQHNPDLFPEVEKLRGDRDGGLAVLQGRKWDAVIDTSGYFPRVVRDSARLLADTTGHYTFISSISVYKEPVPRHVDESGEVGTIEDESTEEVTGESYGPLKALCEQAAEREMPGQTLVIRPGLIVGPYDPSGRFTYWPTRIARGGKVLCPPQDLLVQIIDARDLAIWNLDLIEKGTTGVFNGTGPERVLTMRDVFDACVQAAGSDAEPVYTSDDVLLKNDVGPWMEMPLWIPASMGSGLMETDVSKAFASGLRCRPTVDIARDTIEWAKDAPMGGMPPGAGLTPEKEAEILAKAPLD